MKKFDLIVLGSGPSGGTVAMACAKAGKSVAIVESREFGGTCALRGCNPKKVFVHAAEVIDAARRSDGKLCEAGVININWENLIAFKDTFVDSIPENSRQKFADAGISTFLGSPKFTAENQIEVDGETLESEHILIAVGARPRDLDIDGEHHVTRSDQFMNLKTLPPRVVFIGGGYISMEFAHVACRAGSDVTIIERGERVLKQFEPSIVEHVEKHAASIGIKIVKSAKPTSIKKQDEGAFTIEYERNGSNESFECDLVVHGAGRVPNLDGLDLSAGNVTFDENDGVMVNGSLRSDSNQHVFAAGDCAATGQPDLTTTAETEGDAIVKSLLGSEESEPPDYGPVAKAVFTVPPVASVGLTEKAAKEQSLNFRVEQHDWSDSGTVRKACHEHAASKVLIDSDTDQIIGAHLFGPASSETINVFAVAMASGMTAAKLKSILLAFPTFGYRVRSMV